MASASAGSIFVDLLLQDAKYTQGWQRASTTTKKGTTAISSAVDGATKSLLSLGGALSSIVISGGILAVTKNAIDTASALVDLSDSLGLTTDELQAYQFGAGLASVSAETFQTAIAKLNAKIAEGDLPYKNTGDALRDIADRVKEANTNIERAAIVNEAFGAKLGSKLIPFLKDGSAGIEELTNQAKELGVVIDGETLKRAEAFGDELDRLGQVIKSNFQSGLLDGLVGDSQSLREIYGDQEFISGIREIGKELGDMLAYVAENKETFELLAKILAGAYVGGRVGGGRGALIGAAATFGYNALPDAPKSRDETMNDLQSQAAKFRDLARTMGVEGEGPTADAANQKAIEYVKTKKQLTDEQQRYNKALKESEQAYQNTTRYLSDIDRATIIYTKAVENADVALKAGKISVDQYNEAMKNINKEFEANKNKTDEWAQQVEAISKRAAENIQDAFADFLFDPFADGLDGMLKGFIDTIRKMVAQQAAASFLKGFGEDSDGGGGILGGLIKSVTGAFAGAFAGGGYIPPGQWGITGEAGAEVTYGGKTGTTVIPMNGMGGGTTYNIDARGTDEARIMQLEQMLIATTGPGVIERRVQDAQRRGAQL